MAAATRIGDNTSGTCDIGDPDCCPHGRIGTNSAGSPNVFINEKKAHRLNDAIAIACPHGGSGRSTGGSRSVFINGKAATRRGDSTICIACGQGGHHTNGSANVFIGG